MSKYFWAWLTLVGTVALAAYLAFQAWVHFGPAKPQLSHLRRQVADQTLPLVLADLRQGRQEVRSAVLLHLANDPTDYLTDQLRALIEQSGVLDLRDRTLEEKVQKALNLRVSAVKDLPIALSRARGTGAQGVLFGKVDTFESFASGAKLELELTLAEVGTRNVVFTKRYVKELKVGVLEAAAVKDQVGRLSGAQRLLGWVLAVLLLPVFTISFIRAMVRRESNRANAFTLSVYTAVDALLAYLLLGASLGSWLAALLFLALVGVALAYNVFIMTFALKMEG
jgi:hypothetical protein